MPPTLDKKNMTEAVDQMLLDFQEELNPSGWEFLKSEMEEYFFTYIMEQN